MSITIPSPEFIELFKTTPGAISLHEFFAISWLTEQAPVGVALCVGANAGKCTIAEAIGFARQGKPRTLHLIDTVYDLDNAEAWKDNRTHTGPQTTGWAWIYEPDFKEKVQARIVQASDGLVTAELIGESALKAVPDLAKSGAAWAFSDADNTMKWLVDGIADSLADNIVPGGIIAWHDWNSQFIPPKEASDRLVASGHFEYIKIPWGEIKEAVDSIGGEHHGNNSWHHRETERPMFVGAIRKL